LSYIQPPRCRAGACCTSSPTRCQLIFVFC
jgi:hypothetical protein